MDIHIQLWSLLKNLFGDDKSKLVQPRTMETSIENIVFPDTYRQSFFSPTHVVPRLFGAPTGSTFGQSILNISATQQRDDEIFEQCINGNIPNWMRQFKPITVTDNKNTLSYFVSPDVLCIGDDYDFLRVSLNAYTAKKIADAFNCMLPTKRMSDQIHNQADLKMMPTGMGASFHMSSTKTMIDHNNVIEKQRAGRNFNIIAGHKKDIILHSALLSTNYKHNICIYGFHYPDGRPLQGAQYKAHDGFYQDYSHSIRLISKTALLNNDLVNLMEVLTNKQYSHLVNDEVPYNASFIYKR